MSFKILRTTHISHYKNVMAEAVQRWNESASLDYKEKKQILFNCSAAYSDSFSKAMKELGNDCDEIVFDFEALQKSWADENGIEYDTDDWRERILLAQIKTFKPDILYFQGTYPFASNPAVDLKSEFPFLKIIAVYSGYPEPGKFQAVKGLDIIFCGPSKTCDFYGSQGLNAILVHHGFDTSILSRFSGAEQEKYNFTFAGSSGYAYGKAHTIRFWYLHELLSKTDLRAWLYEPEDTLSNSDGLIKKGLVNLRKNFSANLDLMGEVSLRIIRRALELEEDSCSQPLYFEIDGILKNGRNDGPDFYKVPFFRLSDKFSERCSDAVFGLDMYRLLKSSKVVFNCHTNSNRGQSSNMRLFEATGIGACLLTDRGDNISELFEPDAEVAVYSSLDECIEKYNFLMENDKARREIAAAGQKRTLKDHTVKNRCEEINNCFKELVK